MWLETAEGLYRLGSAGSEAMSAEGVRSALRSEEGADSLSAVALRDGPRSFGALVIRRPRRIDDQGRLFLQAAADVLASALRDAEHVQHLESEIAVRIRETEEHRLFTAKIIDSLPVGLYVIDRSYRIQAWNRKRETGTQGVARDEAIGRTIFEILHRQPAELLRSEFDDVFASGRIQQFQMESVATGELRTYRITKIPMRLEDGAVTHVITVGEDVTDWREAQDRFSQAEKLAAIGTLAAGIMHEINNPLATIAACAEGLATNIEEHPAVTEGTGADLRDALRVIEHEVHRCKGIVDGLLDFSRPKPATKGPVNLNRVIEKTLFLLKHHSRFKQIVVCRKLDGAIPTVQGNEEQLIQVFMALLLNAMDAMEGRGTVTLRTASDARARAVTAEVLDEGAGIRSAELQKIFDPFYTTKPPGRGTGLGLSICYAIVAEHGGRIEVDSATGAGSAFRIVLPDVQPGGG